MESSSTSQPLLAAAPSCPMPESWSIDCGPLPAEVTVSRFQGAAGPAEYHFVVRPTSYQTAAAQLQVIEDAYRRALAACGLDWETALFRRFFASDLTNQAAALAAAPFSDPRHVESPCAVSWVRQPPVPPAKLVLWAYHLDDPAGPLAKSQQNTTMSLRRGELTHHWTCGLSHPEVETSYDQTYAVFAEYESILAERGLTLADHVLRTWLFVQNVDANYHGLVVARRELFAERGLTAETHYLASTGIEGATEQVASRVLMDAYAISGVRPEQVRYIEALDNLSPTHLYGVTFERATSIAYRDRKQILVSGTASINNRGEIVHPGDVLKQTDRTLDNIEALLDAAGATLADMGVYTLYLRDPADCEPTAARMRERVGDAPIAVVVAPVCRPGWLVEVEGIAVISEDNPGLPAW